MKKKYEFTVSVWLDSHIMEQKKFIVIAISGIHAINFLNNFINDNFEVIKFTQIFEQ